MSGNAFLIGSEVEFAKWGLKTCTLDDIKMAKAPFSMPISITSNFLARKVRRLETRCSHSIQRYVNGDVNNGGFDPVDGNGGTNAEFAGTVVAGEVDCVRNGGEVNAADRGQVKQVSPDELSDTGLAPVESASPP
ncbi:hypothetical protein PRIC2_014659 [Phytophthora ramorum]